MATFQVYPSELKDFMTKLNCFCYEEQTLKGGEKEKYSLVLLVDPKVTKNIKEAIIQFVFFKRDLRSKEFFKIFPLVSVIKYFRFLFFGLKFLQIL